MVKAGHAKRLTQLTELPSDFDRPGATALTFPERGKWGIPSKWLVQAQLRSQLSKDVEFPDCGQGLAELGGGTASRTPKEVRKVRAQVLSSAHVMLSRFRPLGGFDFERNGLSRIPKIGRWALAAPEFPRNFGLDSRGPSLMELTQPPPPYASADLPLWATRIRIPQLRMKATATEITAATWQSAFRCSGSLA